MNSYSRVPRNAGLTGRRSVRTASREQPVVEVLRERGREVFRQIKAPNRRHTGSIPRFGNAELAEGSGLDAV